MDAEPAPESGTPPVDRPGEPRPHRRGRRGGRGRRRGGRTSPRPDTQAAAHQPEGEREREGEPRLAAQESVTESAAPETTAAAIPVRDRRPASLGAIQEAIEEVTHIIKTLKDTL